MIPTAHLGAGSCPSITGPWKLGSSAYSHSVFVVQHVTWDAGLGSDDVALLSELLPLIEN